MKKVTKVFVEFCYPGLIFSESSINEVDLKKGFEIPEGAFAFSLSMRDDVIDTDGSVYAGKKYGETGWAYLGGEVWDQEKVQMLAESEPDKYKILYANMVGNRIDHIINLMYRSFPISDKDVVLYERPDVVNGTFLRKMKVQFGDIDAVLKFRNF